MCCVLTAVCVRPPRRLFPWCTYVSTFPYAPAGDLSDGALLRSACVVLMLTAVYVRPRPFPLLYVSVPCPHLQATSLTEHFKELMREQSRIHQQLTEAAVKEAEQVCVVPDSLCSHMFSAGVSK